MEKSRKINYQKLTETLEEAVRKRIPEKGKVGVAFSGGVDSGMIAFVVKKFCPNATLLTVGIKGSADLARAEKMAAKMKMKWVKKIITEKEIHEKYARAEKILKTNDYLQKTIGVVNLSISELAVKEKIYTLFVGSGADELFCGYAAFDRVKSDEKECEKLRTQKVNDVFAHDVEREVKCAKEYGVNVMAPFLDEKMMKEAMKIPACENLRGKYGKIRKNALRMMGEKMGVLKEIVGEPKKAMQYGSGVSKRTKKIVRG
jgi:asparagine synthase (glutamine-hydrolysing)